jgi:hypothetical protein
MGFNKLKATLRAQNQDKVGLSRATVTREIDGHKLSMEVSPCSWVR